METPQSTIQRPPLAAMTCSAPGLRVEMAQLRRAMAYLAIVESVPLQEVTWMENGEVIPVTKEEIDEWKFTGLNNRDFAMFMIEGKKSPNLKVCRPLERTGENAE